MDLGKELRLARTLGDTGRPTVVITTDSLAIYGEGPQQAELADLARSVGRYGVRAVMGFAGAWRRLPVASDLGRIVVLSISTTRGNPLRKVRAHSVEHAVSQGADAVAVQFHIGSRHEGVMLAELGEVIGDARRLGVPVLAMAYARSEEPPSPGDANDLGGGAVHAAQVAVALGVDIVKVEFTADTGLLERIVDACGSTPVLMAGGQLVDLDAWERSLRLALAAGVRGFCVGRNVLDRDDWRSALEVLADVAG